MIYNLYNPKVLRRIDPCQPCINSNLTSCTNCPLYNKGLAERQSMLVDMLMDYNKGNQTYAKQVEFLNEHYRDLIISEIIKDSLNKR